MPLNDLSLAELIDLSEGIDALRAAGEALSKRNIEPRFDLTPGVPVSIMTDVVMPAIGNPPFPYPTRPEILRAEPGSILSFLTPTTPSIEAAPDLTQSGDVGARPPEPLDAPSITGEGIEGAPISADAGSRSDDVASPPPEAPEISQQAAASDEGQAESGGGTVMAAAQPPAAPAPGSASALAASSDRALWTLEEDDRLVALIVEMVTVQGLTKSAALPLAATELGRPVPGTEFRANRKLKDRINGAIFAAATRQAQTETPEAVADRLSKAVVDRPAVVIAQGTEATLPPDLDARSRKVAIDHGTDLASFTADPVTTHLMALTDKGGWTLDRDLELMKLSIAGWQPNEIALQLQMQANAIRPRFDTLTGLHEDATGKKVRRFTRDDVYAALTRLAGKAA